MTQSVELLLGDEAELTVRERWRRLQDAGLPSMADHTGETNRPHITIGVANVVPTNAETEMHSLVSHLPMQVGLGGLVVFGSGAERVLAWLVVPGRALLELQAGAARMMPSPMRHLQPGAWTPHVTLARRIPVERLGEAVTALGDMPELTTSCRQIRRWDSERRRVWLLSQESDSSA